MGSAVANYRRPETTEDAAEVVKVFLQAEFGMNVDIREADGPAGCYYIAADLDRPLGQCGVALVMVGDVGYPYALDDEEMEAVEAIRKGAPPGPHRLMKLDATEAAMVEAHRNRGGARRPVVLAGWVEPRTVEELVEVVRMFLDVNFGFCLDEHRDVRRIDIQGDYADDVLPQTSIIFAGDEGDFVEVLTEDEFKHLKAYRAAKGKAKGGARRSGPATPAVAAVDYVLGGDVADAESITLKRPGVTSHASAGSLRALLAAAAKGGA